MLMHCKILTVFYRVALLLRLFRVRVDMTKFIERHKFIFDEVFDTDATNEDVSDIACISTDDQDDLPTHHSPRTSYFLSHGRSTAGQHSLWSSICLKVARPLALHST